MARLTWVLLVAAIIAAGALVWWPRNPVPSPGPSASVALNPSAPPPSLAASGSDQPAPAAPSFDVVRVAPGGSAVIAGRAEPGVEITIRDGSNEIGRAVADPRGEWVVLPKDALSPGTHTLVVETPTGARSEDVAVYVPEPKPGKVEQPVAVLLPKDAAPRPLQPATQGLSLDAVEYDDKGQVVVGGQAKPGSEVRIYLGGATFGRATADENGRWETRPTRAIAPGMYTLRADEMRPDGSVAARVSVPFQRAVLSDDAAHGRIVVQPGDNLWNIARNAYGAGPRYAVIYAANQTDIRDPDLIFPGQVFTLPGN
jgi:nucleoid-associated protein YgaU